MESRILCASMVAGLSHAACAQQFVDLGPCTADAISADGSTVVGWSSSTRAFRWTPQNGMQSLGMPVGYNNMYASAVNADGNVIVGFLDGTGTNPNVAFRWTPGVGVQVLTSGTSAYGADVSADGETVLIHRFSSPQVWTVASGLQPLSIPGVWAGQYATGLSADGVVAAGYVVEPPSPSSAVQGYTWTPGGGAALFPGMKTVEGISPDGGVLFGTLYDGVGYPFVRKPVGSPPVTIGTLPGTLGTTPIDSNADGSVIVGYGWYSGGAIPEVPAIWTPDTGLQRLEPYLASNGVTVPANFQLTRALAISDDALTIAGIGLVGGVTHGFVTKLGSGTCYPNCDASPVPPVLNVADFTCFLQRFAAGESYANCDGSTTAPVLNVADFTCFLQAFAAGCP